MPVETPVLIASQANQLREHDLHSLPELFFENTKLHRFSARILGHRVMQFFADPRKLAATQLNSKSYPTRPRVALPPYRYSSRKAGLDELLAQRQSAALNPAEAAFGIAPVAVDALGQLLFYAYGVTREVKIPLSGPGGTGDIPTAVGRKRTAPSGGGLYPLELYAICLNVSGLDVGVYHYNAFGHYLETLMVTDRVSLETSVTQKLTSGLCYDEVAVVLITTAIPLRTTYKYGDRGYRFLLIEAGHVAQNIYLGATDLGLSVCSIGGYLDDELHDLIGVDGLDELTVNVMVCGMPR